MLNIRTSFVIFFVATVAVQRCHGRAVNSSTSSTWTLPSIGFPVFYRHFRDKISWFEADAVCQFHHANLATVNNPGQFDAVRAFLKRNDVTDNVWIGLMRGENSNRFKWTNSEDHELSTPYWAEELPVGNAMLCAAIDPIRDYRWHALRCGGPATASFICEMKAPEWVFRCTSNIHATNTVYDTETGNLHLVRECDRKLVKIAVCNAKTTHHEVERELSCMQDQQERFEEQKPRDLTDLLEKPIKNLKKISFKKMAQAVPNKKYSKIPKFDIMEDDEMMQGDEPRNLNESTTTDGSATTTSAASTTQEFELSSESYETTSDGVDTETRTRRETIAAESSTMAMSVSGGTVKKYSHQNKSDFEKHELNLSGKSLGKSHPQIYSPQVMRKEFPRPEVSNITSKKSDHNQASTGDMFVPPLLLVKSHFPHHTKEFEPVTVGMPHNTIEIAFNETFENETTTEEFLEINTRTTVAEETTVGLMNTTSTAASAAITIEEVPQTLEEGPHEIEKKDHRCCVAEFTNQHHDESEKSVKKQLSTQNISHDLTHPELQPDDPVEHVLTTEPQTLEVSTGESTARSVTPLHHDQPSSKENQLEDHESSLNNADYNAEDFRPNRHRILTSEPANNYIKRVLG